MERAPTSGGKGTSSKPTTSPNISSSSSSSTPIMPHSKATQTQSQPAPTELPSSTTVSASKTEALLNGASKRKAATSSDGSSISTLPEGSTPAMASPSTLTTSSSSTPSTPSLTLDTSSLPASAPAAISASVNGSSSLSVASSIVDSLPSSVPFSSSTSSPSSSQLPHSSSSSPVSIRRRPSSQSPDRGADNARASRGASNGSWARGGKKLSSGGHSNGTSNSINNNSNSSSSFRNPSFSSNNSLPSKPAAALGTGPTSNGDFGGGNTYNGSGGVGAGERKAHPSMSVPSTPQFAKKATRNNRTPSPSKAISTSPQSAMSEPVKHSRSGAELSGCMFETALTDSRRRMPYSLGVDRLAKESGIRERLTAEEEDSLTRQIETLVERLQPTPEIEERRRKFVEKLENIFNTTWPGHNIRVRTFGSTVNRLSSKDSDVDVCVTTEWNGLEPVCKVAKALDKAGMERIVCVAAAKVPIVKISDPEFGVACDMNINNIGALENTRMIKTYVDIDPRVRPLAMVIKYWTKKRIINDAAGGGTLSSYTWTCMILNFLQTRDPPILPSLHKRKFEPRVTEDGQKITFDDDIESLRGFGEANKETLGGLLYAFFRKYGHEYDYDQSVISVREGTIKPKKGTSWFFIQNNRLCIEEPFNTNRNLGNTADDTSIRGLHLELRRACRILAEAVDLEKCCEQYVFPPEPTRESIPSGPAVHSHGVRITAVPGSRGRGGYGGARGRTYGGYGRQNNSGFRRSSNSSGSQYYSQQHQQPIYDTNNFFYAQPSAEQFYSALMQAQQLQLYQQAQAAHAQVQAHMQQAQQRQSQHARDASQSSASAHDQQIPTNLQQFSALFPYAYSPMFGLPSFFYAPHMQQEPSQASSSVPASPPITPNAPDMRSGVGRGRRNNYASRSRSQPPTNGYQPQPSLPRTYGGQATINPSDDEYDYGDMSSNGSVNQHVLHRASQPETPPDDEISDEYAGFILDGVLHPEIISEQVHVPPESYVAARKDFVVERQKRLSSEKLPSPLLDRRKMSHPPSPLLVERTLVERTTPPSVLGGTAGHGRYEEQQHNSKPNKGQQLYLDTLGVGIGSPSSRSSAAIEDHQLHPQAHPHSLFANTAIPHFSTALYGISRHVDLMQPSELRNVRSSPALNAYTAHHATASSISPLLSPSLATVGGMSGMGDAASTLRQLNEEHFNHHNNNTSSSNSRLAPNVRRAQGQQWKSQGQSGQQDNSGNNVQMHSMRKMKSRNTSQEDLASQSTVTGQQQQSSSTNTTSGGLSAIPEGSSRGATTTGKSNSSGGHKSHHHGHHHHGHHSHHTSSQQQNGSTTKDRSIEHQPPPTPATTSASTTSPTTTTTTSRSTHSKNHHHHHNHHSHHNSSSNRESNSKTLQSNASTGSTGDETASRKSGGGNGGNGGKKGGYNKIKSKKKKGAAGAGQGDAVGERKGG